MQDLEQSSFHFDQCTINPKRKFRNVSSEDGEILTERDLSVMLRTCDFIEIDEGFGSGPCDCCGYKWVNYQERMTSPQEPPRPNRNICKKCYQIAKQAETAPIRFSPVC